MTTPGNPITPGQRENVARMLERVRKVLAFQAKVWPDARTTLAGLSLRGAVLGPLSHEEFRSMDRATVPLPGLFSYHRDPAPWEYHPPRGVAIDWPRGGHPGRVRLVEARAWLMSGQDGSTHVKWVEDR